MLSYSIWVNILQRMECILVTGCLMNMVRTIYILWFSFLNYKTFKIFVLFLAVNQLINWEDLDVGVHDDRISVRKSVCLRKANESKLLKGKIKIKNLTKLNMSYKVQLFCRFVFEFCHWLNITWNLFSLFEDFNSSQVCLLCWRNWMDSTSWGLWSLLIFRRWKFDRINGTKSGSGLLSCLFFKKSRTTIFERDVACKFILEMAVMPMPFNSYSFVLFLSRLERQIHHFQNLRSMWSIEFTLTAKALGTIHSMIKKSITLNFFQIRNYHLDKRLWKFILLHLLKMSEF